MDKSSHNLLTKNAITQIVANRSSTHLESSLAWIVRPLIDEFNIVSPDWDKYVTHEERLEVLIGAIIKALPNMQGYVTVMWNKEIQAQAVHRLASLVSAVLEAALHDDGVCQNSMCTAIGMYIATGEVPGLHLDSQLRPDLPYMHYTTLV